MPVLPRRKSRLWTVLAYFRFCFFVFSFRGSLLWFSFSVFLIFLSKKKKVSISVPSSWGTRTVTLAFRFLEDGISFPPSPSLKWKLYRDPWDSRGKTSRGFEILTSWRSLLSEVVWKQGFGGLTRCVDQHYKDCVDQIGKSVAFYSVWWFCSFPVIVINKW